MKIQHKYLRNRAFQSKCWNRMRQITHPFETYMPYTIWRGTQQYNSYSEEEQIRSNFEWIEIRARSLDKGEGPSFWHHPYSCRHLIERQNRAKVKSAMKKINNGYWETEVPIFKYDADWDWF